MSEGEGGRKRGGSKCVRVGCDCFLSEWVGLGGGRE